MQFYNCMRLVGVCLLAVVVLPRVVEAREGDGYSFYASSAIGYDNNILRQSKNVTNQDKSDVTRTQTIGGEIDMNLGRQKITFSGSLSDNKYNRVSGLDYQGENYSTRLDWKLGNHFDGDISYGYSKRLAGLADFKFQNGSSNLRTNDSLAFNGNWQFHPRWRLGLSLTENEYAFLSPTQKGADRNETGIEVSLKHFIQDSTSVAIRLKQLKGDSPNRIPLNPYELDSAILSADWQATAQNKLKAEFGYIKRTSELSATAFTNLNKRVHWIWLPTAKINTDFSVYSEAAVYDDTTASFTVSDGLSLNMNWTPTYKIHVSGGAKYGTREYIANGTALQKGRNDTLRTYNLSVSYRPTQYLNFGASLVDDERESNIANIDYSTKSINLTASFNM